jgi:hypothetical protein
VNVWKSPEKTAVYQKTALEVHCTAEKYLVFSALFRAEAMPEGRFSKYVA